MASSNEHIRVKLPEGFDPARHIGGLAKKIAEKQGEGFEFDSIVDGASNERDALKGIPRGHQQPVSAPVGPPFQ